MMADPHAPVTRGEQRLLIAALLVGAALRLALLANHGLNSTELITWRVMGLPLGELMRERLEANHVPVYFAALKVWTLAAGRGEVALRLPSVLLGVLSIGVVWWVARRMFSPRAALAAAWIGALHEYWLHTSLEARVYGPLMLLCLAMAGAFWQYAASGRRRWAIAYVVASCLALGTQLLALSMVAGLAVWWVVSGYRLGGRRRFDAAALGLALSPLVVLAPLIVQWAAVQEKVGAATAWQMPEGGGRVRRDMLRLAFGDYDYVGYFGDAAEDAARALTVPLTALTIFAAACLRWLARGAARRGAALDLLFINIALPGLIVYAATMKSDNILGILRYLSVAAAFMPLLVAAAWAQAPEKWWRAVARPLRRLGAPRPEAVRAAAGGLVALALVAHTAAYILYPGDGIRAAIRHIKSVARPGDRAIVCAGGGVPGGFDFYEAGVAVVDLGRREKDLAVVRRKVSEALGEEQRLHVLMYHAEKSPLLEVLDAGERRLRRIETRRFSEARYYLYERAASP